MRLPPGKAGTIFAEFRPFFRICVGPSSDVTYAARVSHRPSAAPLDVKFFLQNHVTKVGCPPTETLMLPDSSSKRGQGGFSLFEVAVILSVGLILAAIGLPRMTNVIAMQKLRGSMTTASSFLQNVRMLAIKKNRTMTAFAFNRTERPYSLVYWTKESTDSSSFSPQFSQVELQAPITKMDSPTGPGAPPAITNGALGLLVNPEVGDPSFNSRGLPCKVSGTDCDNKAFIKYFKDNRIGGSGGWAAVSITPAGRIKRWFWNGSAWTD